MCDDVFGPLEVKLTIIRKRLNLQTDLKMLLFNLGTIKLGFVNKPRVSLPAVLTTFLHNQLHRSPAPLHPRRLVPQLAPQLAQSSQPHWELSLRASARPSCCKPPRPMRALMSPEKSSLICSVWISETKCKAGSGTIPSGSTLFRVYLTWA